MFNWFKKNKGKKNQVVPSNIEEEVKEIVPIDEEDNSPIVIPDFVSIKENEDGIGAVFNTDKMSVKDKEEVFNSISKKEGIPIFKGKIENGFSLVKVKSTDICPMCSGKTVQHYADFVYSNGETSRVNTSPFGYFCESCPTVVIDVKRLSKGLPDGIEFHGIGGVSTTQDGLMLFKLWNNEKPIHILDEDHNFVGITTRREMKNNPEAYADFHRSWEGETNEWQSTPTNEKKKVKRRKRNKSAKKSRRNNRRKK